MQIIEFSDFGVEPGANVLPSATLDKMVERISSSDLTIICGIPFQNAPAVFELQSRRGDLPDHEIDYFLHKDTRLYSIIASKRGYLYHA